MATFIQLDDSEREKTPPRLQEDLRRQHRLLTVTTEFGAALDVLDIAQHRVARLFAVGPRSV